MKTAFASMLVMLGCGGSVAPADGAAPLPDAHTPDAGPPPPGTGWFEIANTRLETLCPDGSCGGVVSAWGGGIAETDRARMIVWGGGHNDYSGNEVYAFDVATSSIARLTDPSPTDDCQVSLPDGRPASRHTYGNLAYISDLHRMWAWGGAPACTNGGGSDDTWTLDLDALAWQRMDPTAGDAPEAFISASDYDAPHHRVLMQNTHSLYAYDYASNAYTRVGGDDGTDYHLSGVIDTDRAIFVLAGGGEYHEYDVGGTGATAMSSPAVTGCDAILGYDYPGLAYDPIGHVVVAWAGGDDVYLLDTAAHTCAVRTFPNGPGPAQPNGTNGRFRYFPTLDAFALVNAMDQNAYVLRLRAAP